MKLLITLILLCLFSAAQAQHITAKQMLKIIGLKDTVAIKKAIIKRGFKPYPTPNKHHLYSYTMTFVSKRRTKHVAGPDSTNHTFIQYRIRNIDSTLAVSFPTEYFILQNQFKKLGFVGTRGHLQPGFVYVKDKAPAPCYYLLIPLYNNNKFVSYELSEADCDR